MTPLAPSSVEVSGDRRRLVVGWPGGRETTAPAAWLYDNAEGGFDPKSGHRLHGALTLAGALEIGGARTEAGAVVVRFAPGGETRRISLAALAGAEAGTDAVAPRLWATADEVAAAPPVAFEACLADDRALRDVLDRVVQRGIAFLVGAGSEPGTVERLVARFGYVRETNYGRLFDVREEIAATHLAYTPVGLDLHTDNPYRDPVPTLQVLHVIEAAADGGESQFTDGFAHAAALRAAAPARFDVLAATPVEFAYVGPSGERYAARVPIIETSAAGEVVGVCLNHRSLCSPPPEAAEPWYEAYLDFYQRLHAPAARLERKLWPGDVAVFDNRRVLHGRSPYHGGAIRRWLQGCYADIDGLKATLSRLPPPEGGGGE
jgi:[2-(trimethylamino)ethyl]phosphonate dioxygenase